MAIVQTLIGNIKGPQGATGPQGEQGVAGNAATITVGTTSTTAYGNPARVTNVGTSSDAILDFVIPQGERGEAVTELDDLTLNTITTATAEYPQIAIGDTGSTIFGKIIKFFQDLVSKKVDTSAVVNNFTTTQAGYVADARTVSTLMDALSQKGSMVTANAQSSDLSVSPSTWTNVNSITLTAGTWLVTARFTTNTANSGMIAKRIAVNIGTAGNATPDFETQASPDGRICFNMQKVITLNSTTQIISRFFHAGTDTITMTRTTTPTFGANDSPRSCVYAIRLA